jgi:hypothetical protein
MRYIFYDMPQCLGITTTGNGKKVKLSLRLTKHHAMKMYCGVEVMPQPLYLWGKKHPVDRRLGGPQSQSGHSGKEKNSQPLPRIEPRPSNL